MNEKCPNCNADIRYYHGEGVTRAVCSKHCEGWKVLEEIDHLDRLKKMQNSDIRKLKERPCVEQNGLR